ncbi:MAG: hypothetical protein JWO08_3841 [Verrucomicrobiaceae bacterium]|nr:hypothetical protein [Verrucomicrobiaceae bacterium]
MPGCGACVLRRVTPWLLCSLANIGFAASDKVVVQLKWKHAFQFAGYYAAVEKGYQAESRLGWRCC